MLYYITQLLFISGSLQYGFLTLGILNFSCWTPTPFKNPVKGGRYGMWIGVGLEERGGLGVPQRKLRGESLGLVSKVLAA